MIRISTIFFCLLLAAAAAGRYQAEAKVRADKAEIRDIEQQIEMEEQQISKLKLEVEVLESGQRLSQLAVHKLDLTSMKPYQLHTADEFAALLELPVDTASGQQDKNGDFILDAIAMADFATPAR
jgi:hypothetical protein